MEDDTCARKEYAKHMDPAHSKFLQPNSRLNEECGPRPDGSKCSADAPLLVSHVHSAAVCSFSEEDFI